MEHYIFSNSDIDKACGEVGKFLSSAGVERRETLRIKLTFEEILLKYQEKLGEEASFKVRLVKRLSSVKVEIIVAGESFDALSGDTDDDDIIRRLLAGIGLAPTWSYKSGKNHIIFTPKKKPLSGTIKMVAAIVLAVIVGMILNILPNEIRMGANDYVLTPVTNAFMGLISAVSVPLIFLSVLGSICSMGNMETLGKIGVKTIKIILLYMVVIAVYIIAVGCLFYPIQLGGGETANFEQVLDLIYDIIPSSLFEPFITGNTLQIIFIAVIIGLSMLILSSGVSGVFGIVEQLGSITQTMMAGLSSMLPVLIFFLFAGMISNGNLGAILSSWKMVLVIVVMVFSFYVLNILRIAILQKVSPLTLFKKALPTFLICITTASSAAAFSTNLRDANTKLGIDKKLVEFGIPLGQVLYMPGFVALLYGLGAGFAESYSIPMTLPWIFTAFITSLLVSFAIPPIPGGAMLGLTIVFAQLGIPMEVMGVALAVNAITDFPCTACNISSWQLTLIDVADSLNMLDKEVLRKNG